MKAFVSAVVTLMLVVAVVTAVALELGGVVTVHTTSANGAHRTTHIWYVETEDGLFIEAGHPDNPWVTDLQDAHELHLSGQGIDGRYRFVMHTTPASHAKIRTLMREKYGWRDVWVGMLFDVSASRMMELTKQAEAGTQQ